MSLRKKIFIFQVLFLLFFLTFHLIALAADCDADEECKEGEICFKGKCIESRGLEVVYPSIEGITPKFVHTRIGDYVNYIFRFSVLIVGIVILGALIVNGLNYLTSFGNPEKLSEAKSGIFSAFLGAIILLSSFILINTINPQLLIVEPEKIKIIAQTKDPGVYVCNHKIDKIEEIMKKYLTGSSKERRKAMDELDEAMGDPAKTKKICFRANSGPFQHFSFKKGSQDHTVFIIPSKKLTEECNPEDENKEIPEDCWIWNYGVVFHEKSNLTGKCQLWPSLQSVAGTAGNNFSIFHKPSSSDYYPEFDFKVKGITVFTKTSPPEGSEGVTLYEGKQYNEIGKEEEEKEKEKTPTPSLKIFPFAFAQEVEAKLAKKSFVPELSADVLKVEKNDLQVSATSSLYQNTRSIDFDPKEDGFLALLLGKGKDDATKDSEYEVCEVREKQDANLMDNSIGRCGCLLGWKALGKCDPCLQKMYVIKGKRI